jgi:hypothetical protein
MPTLSIFFGIIIKMRHDDNPPPHIHIEFQGFTALVEIRSGNVIAGDLPRKVAAIVNEWCETHHIELMNNWEKACQFEPLNRIQGADRD